MASPLDNISSRNAASTNESAPLVDAIVRSAMREPDPASRLESRQTHKLADQRRLQLFLLQFMGLSGLKTVDVASYHLYYLLSKCMHIVITRFSQCVSLVHQPAPRGVNLIPKCAHT